MHKNKVLIISLVLCLFAILAVGYAAFSTMLTINGTSNITSSWQVEITNATIKEVSGAQNVANPIVSPEAVTFNTDLVSPGDYVIYEVTVSNEGSIDAKLNKITKTDTNNPAIIFSVDGITEGETLTHETSKTFTVTVSYNNAVTSQPDITTSTLTVLLDYVQA